MPLIDYYVFLSSLTVEPVAIVAMLLWWSTYDVSLQLTICNTFVRHCRLCLHLKGGRIIP